MIVRPARDDEDEVIGRIWFEAWGDGHRGHVPDGLVAHRGRDQFVVRATERLVVTLVAEVDGDVVGFVSVHDDELEQLFVDRSARGSGIAAALLHAGEDAIRAAGHATAWLSVVAGNERARAFYEREGWHDVGPLAYEAQTADGTITVPSRRYECNLDV